MTAKEVYKIWAPKDVAWADWVRPVPFVAIDSLDKTFEGTPLNSTIPIVEYESELNQHTAVIVDLPGDESIRMGIALGKLGVRPIPIYNGTLAQQGARATVNSGTISAALVRWALDLEVLKLTPEAPPAFLIDRNRLNRYKLEEAVYDNSWDVYPQDMPSAQYIKDKGIKRVLVVGGRSVARDLKKILKAYQDKGIQLLHTTGYSDIKRIAIKKHEEKN